MSLDLILFRDDQGGDSGKMRDIQTKRFKDVTHVDKVIETDTKWRKRELKIIDLSHKHVYIQPSIQRMNLIGLCNSDIIWDYVRLFSVRFQADNWNKLKKNCSKTIGAKMKVHVFYI